MSGLQNDYKSLIKQIEAGLYELHAKARAERQVGQSGDDESVMDTEQGHTHEAFVQVDRVDVGSPANQAVCISTD